ncbi:MAG TPA: tRNA preQ1(34) S-adenosylmethionine ribosyltransferase-isomerase QueA [Bryobacteraceae bacterium]|jgi:S-adenosylmethionine:tRNA ribosyltransferase-isomerase|nr:tRNA preQ1(34) S-adenosylmethionine ribosyltransferase-isomerase QueA [Bryobacteraceae bacterium]
MRLSDFDYELPEELIAQSPPAERDAARMLVVHRAEQRFEDRMFRDLPSFLGPGDCLVLNDSRVIPSRLLGHRQPSGASAEILLLESVSEDAREWRALVRPGRKLRVGDVVRFDESLSVEIVAHGERGERTIRFRGATDVYSAIDRLGHMPLPPYIKRADRAEDRERYQTVFARERGSSAAPTAGLHFTGEVLDRIAGAGAHSVRVTLHVGLGTFQPIEREDFENHQLHFERYSVSADAWREIEAARRVVAVGTTSVRTLESAAGTGALAGSTNLFIHPGYEFQRVGAMLTNFHLPRTSLLLLVCAFAGTEFALRAYRHAVTERYRFFSYGDCMLIV